jgi:hypothetical protein
MMRRLLLLAALAAHQALAVPQALAGDGTCSLASEVCVDGPSTKVIGGQPITRPCWQALHQAESYTRDLYRWPLWDVGATVALVRLELLAGTPAGEIEKIRLMVSRTHHRPTVVHGACFEAFAAALFERITPAWRWGLADYAVGEVCSRLRLDLLANPLCMRPKG